MIVSKSVEQRAKTDASTVSGAATSSVSGAGKAVLFRFLSTLGYI